MGYLACDSGSKKGKLQMVLSYLHLLHIQKWNWSLCILDVLERKGMAFGMEVKCLSRIYQSRRN